MEASWFERNDHPLLNHLVLTKVFESVHGLDLLSCRLVCKTWTISTLPSARSRLQVTIKNVPDLEKCVKLIKTNILGIPFGRFRLGPFDMTEGVGQEFVQLCGETAIEYTSFVDNCEYKLEDISVLLQASPKLESFEIPKPICSKDGPEKIVKLFQNTNPKFPSLNYLDVGREWPMRMKICPTLYDELIGAAENISTLDLNTLIGNYEGEYECAEILRILEKFGREKSIKILKLPFMNQEILEVLGKMVSKGLVLRGLGFKVRCEEFYNFDWVVFLQLFKENLIALQLNTYIPMPIAFPIMRRLKILNLGIYRDSRLFCESFTHTFPVLQKFIYHSTRNTDDFLSFVTGQQGSSTMKSLNLRQAGVDMEVLNRILTVFPALNELDCSIAEKDGVEVIRKIWTHMTQLQVLKISCTLPAEENVDSLVTGIPVEDMKEIDQTYFSHVVGQMEIEARTEEILTQISKHRRLLSIGNLTNLKYLSLSFTSQKCKAQRRNYITDLTVYFGLYSVKSLRHLNVSDCEISKLCAEILVKDSGLVNWKFNASSKYNYGQIIPLRWNLWDESLTINSNLNMCHSRGEYALFQMFHFDIFL